MKRTHCYEVNHLMKTVVVTRRFLEEASQMGTPAADLMEQFIEKGFTVTVYHKAPRKAAKPENGKLPLLTYRMMEAYIAMLDDAEDIEMTVKEAVVARFNAILTDRHMRANESATRSGITPSTVYSIAMIADKLALEQRTA